MIPLQTLHRYFHTASRSNFKDSHHKILYKIVLYKPRTVLIWTVIILRAPKETSQSLNKLHASVTISKFDNQSTSQSITLWSIAHHKSDMMRNLCSNKILHFIWIYLLHNIFKKYIFYLIHRIFEYYNYNTFVFFSMNNIKHVPEKMFIFNKKIIM